LKKLNKEKTKKLNAQIKKLLNNDAALKKEMDELFNAGVLILIFCKIKLGLRKK